MFSNCRGCKIILGIVIIILGITMMISGFILYKDKEAEFLEDDDAINVTSEKEVIEEDVEKEALSNQEDSDTSNNAQNETMDDSTNMSEDTHNDMDSIVETRGFKAENMYIAYSFFRFDGSVISEENLPVFHRVDEISVNEVSNPKTERPSQALKVVLSGIPDRPFSISVLINTDSEDYEGYQAKEIPGVHLEISYQEGVFSKSLYEIGEDLSVSPLDAETYNIRYEGLETTATIEFFSPLETNYYLVMIEDETFFTRIQPQLVE